MIKEISEGGGKMAGRKVTEKERQMLQRWDRFVTEQSGVYPASIAAIKLGMTHAGVYAAAQRGWIAFFQIGRDRWYSRKDISRYLEARRAKKNYASMRASEPKNYTEENDGGAWRGNIFREL